MPGWAMGKARQGDLGKVSTTALLHVGCLRAHSFVVPFNFTSRREHTGQGSQKEMTAPFANTDPLALLSPPQSPASLPEGRWFVKRQLPQGFAFSCTVIPQTSASPLEGDPAPHAKESKQ